MRLGRSVLIFGLGFGLTGSGVRAAWGADANTAPVRQGGQEKNVPTIQVFSRETLVDVMVTDAKGRPVHGLKRGDFTVEEDGKPQPIRGFSEFGTPGRAVTAHVPPKLPPGVYTNYESAPASGPVNIFLLDALNGNADSVAYSQQQIREYLDRMPAGTQVAVCLLSVNGLQVVQGFTSNGSMLRQAMNINFLAYLSSTDSRERKWTTIYGLDRLATYVQGIKGRKNLFWFVPGMPVYVTHDGGYGWGLDGQRAGAPATAKQDTGDVGMVHRLMDVYERFTAEQIAISPIDPSGPRDLGVAGTGDYGSMRKEAVAEETGGKALYNSNDVTGLVEYAVRDESQFYTLAYGTPRQKDDGHFHAIKVTVARPGLKLVYRKGYNSETPQEPARVAGAALMTASMTGSAPAATEMLFDVGVKPGMVAAQAGDLTKAGQTLLKKEKAAAVSYEFEYLVPQSQIKFAGGPDGARSGSLKFEITAFDVQGKLVASGTQTMELPLSAEEYSEFVKQPFRFSQQMDLPPGPLVLRAGVLDGVSNKVGTLEIPLVVRPPAGGASGPVAPCPPRCPLPGATAPGAGETK